MPEPTEKDVFKEFKEHSIAEFFKKNRQMLGYSGKIKSLTTVVHEYVTNSLDACEEVAILPDIFVQVERLGAEHFRIINEDNGPGIPKKFVGKAFGKMLAGTKFHRFRQARGQQGIGASGCVMYGQITTGKPTKVVSGQGKGTIYDCMLTIDTKTNEPKITEEKEYPGTMRGTRIETEIKDVMYQKSEYGPDEYIRRTALANPHAKITYIDPDGQTVIYDRSVKVVPAVPKETKPHPKGVEVDDLLTFANKTTARTVKSFLSTEFTRMSSQKATEIEKLVHFDMNKRPRDMTWDEAEQVVKAIRETSFVAPPTDCLIPISEEHLDKALASVLQPEFKMVLTRPPAVFRGGVPFVVEVALAYGGKAGRPATNGNGEASDRMEIMRFANRVPLLFDSGACALSKAVQSIEWKHYDIKPDVPITVLVNFTSIYVPYTGAGKQAVSDEEEIIKEIRLALMDAARGVGRYVSGVRRKYERETRMKQLLRYVQPVAESIAKLTGKSEKLIDAKLKELVETKYGEYAEAEGVEEDAEGNGREAEETGDEAAE
jgi:DNA topoisomerase-6 subunit B